jgi:hypothetical protein
MAFNNLPSVVDFKWMSRGGLLIDSSGDISFNATTLESIQDMIATRLKAAANGWQSYTIGADLESLIGSTDPEEIEIAIQKQITQSLTNQFLQKGSFTVQTISSGKLVNVYVYIQETLVASTSVNVG